MPDVLHPTCRLLLLDLRISKRAPQPPLPGLARVIPNRLFDDGENGATPLAVLVAIDGEAAYAEWQQRFLRWCPRGFPHIILLDPWNPSLARSIVQGGGRLLRHGRSRAHRAGSDPS